MRQSIVYPICSLLAFASKFAPITSASRVRRNVLRFAVALNAHRSRRCAAPVVYPGISCLEPAPTYRPTASDAPGASSDAIVAPLLRTVTCVVGAVAGKAGGSGIARPGSGVSIGGAAGGVAPPKIAPKIDGLPAAGVVSAGSDMAAAEDVRTPRVAARIAFERTMAARLCFAFLPARWRRTARDLRGRGLRARGRGDSGPLGIGRSTERIRSRQDLSRGRCILA